MVQYYITVLNWGEILLHYSACNSSERQRQHILAYLIATCQLPFCIFGEGFMALWTHTHKPTHINMQMFSLNCDAMMNKALKRPGLYPTFWVNTLFQVLAKRYAEQTCKDLQINHGCQVLNVFFFFFSIPASYFPVSKILCSSKQKSLQVVDKKKDIRGSHLP